jgi:radical SAM protein with 4Fe4S-binding SPASM domain
MNCGHIPSIYYDEFTQRMKKKVTGSRTPVVGSFDVTSRCNLRCVHCYIQGTTSEDDLTYQEICHILDQITEEGCLWLLVTGGEPLSRPDFQDIFRYIKRKGILITLFTNGTLITPAIADFLAEYPPYAVEITLYGMTADTYERVTGIPGSFERCQRGIELLRERNLYLRLKSMILSINRHELAEMKRYADNLGVTFRHDCMINAKLDGSMEPVKLRLSPHDIVALDMIDEKHIKAWHEYFDRFGSVPANDNLYTCSAGVNSFHISSTGRLDLCAVSRKPDYDLRRGTFHDGFYNAIPDLRAKKRTRYSECQTCDLLGICEQCPAWGQLEHGDPEAKVDFLCQVTKLRAAALKDALRIQAET